MQCSAVQCTASLMAVSIAAIEPNWISEIHGLWREKHVLNLSRRTSAWLSRLAKSAMHPLAMHNPPSPVLESCGMDSPEETYAYEPSKIDVSEAIDCDPGCDGHEDGTCTHQSPADAASSSKNADERVPGAQVVRLLEHVSSPSGSEDSNRRDGFCAASSGSDMSATTGKRVLHLHEHLEAERQSDGEPGNDPVCFCRTPTSWNHADVEELAIAGGDEFGEADACHEAQSAQETNIDDDDVRRPFKREVKFQGLIFVV